MSAKTIFIAGGNSGIGRATVDRLQTAGAHLVCAGRNLQDLVGIPNLTVLPFDATSPELPGWDLPDVIDGFVYCPGTINLKPFPGLDDDDFRQDFEVNVLGAVRLIRKLLPALKRSRSASIVLFSTVAVQVGLSYHASVSVSKGAVEGLTRALAAEFAPSVRVNCIAPGLTDTPLAANLLNSDKKRELARQRSPLGQVGDPSDLAALVEFLLGDHSRFITGQVLAADGGLSAVRPL